jgi:hypothetical protein
MINSRHILNLSIELITKPQALGSTSCYKCNGTKPVAGSQFLGGHCRKNVTEAEPKKKFSEQINIGDLPPTPPRQKIFGQCTILGVKKNFPELLIANIAQFLSEYCTTTFI